MAKWAETFMTYFLQGYLKKNKLGARWLKEISYFLKLREMTLYGAIYRSFDLKNIKSPFAKKFMHQRQERIEKQTPVIDFDFEKLTPLFPQ